MPSMNRADRRRAQRKAGRSKRIVAASVVALGGLASGYMQMLRQSPSAYASGPDCTVSQLTDSDDTTVAGSLSDCLWQASSATGTFTIQFGTSVDLYASLSNIDLTGAVDVVIDGNGKTLDGMSARRAFDVTLEANQSLAISDLTVTSTSTTTQTGLRDYGSALLARNQTAGGEVTLDNVSVIGGSAAWGGAVYVQRDIRLYVQDSYFKDNYASDKGGAIIHYGGSTDDTFIVTNSTFVGNDAIDWGGAVGAKGARPVFTDDTFIDNYGGDYGGAIYGANDVFVTGSTFTGNDALEMGGGVYASDSAYVYHSYFADNTAVGTGGGAVVAYDAYLTVEDSDFVGNYAYAGGALYNEAPDTIRIVRSTFVDNGAEYYGGAIYFRSGGSTTIVDSSFTGNFIATADYDGGALKVENPTYVTGSTFSGNTADLGGAIYAADILDIENSTFTSNASTSLTSKGGAIYSKDDLSMRFVTMSGNDSANATNGGAAVYAVGASVSLTATVIDDTSAVNPCFTAQATIDDSYTLAVDPSGSCGLGGTGSDNTVTSAALQLGALADNGGLTFTQLPASTSPLVTGGPMIDMGIPVDQRGIARPSGVPLRFTIGAVQVGSATPPPPPDPVFVPSAPRDVTAVAGDRSAVVSWREPVSEGSFPVSTYKATATPGGQSCLVVAPTLTCGVTGLANGTPYTFTVEALNGAGWSPKGGPSNAVTPGGVTPAPAPVPLPGPLPPGDSLLQTNGVVDPNVTVDPNTKSDGLVIQGDGWRMDLDGLGPDGKPLNLGPDGSLRLANERDVATEGTGFLPNSEVDLYVDPPVLLTGAAVRAGTRAGEQGIYVGTVKTDARGSFSGTATLPADIAPGDHVLQAVGYSPAAQTRAMSLGVIVEPWIVLDQGTRKAEGMHDRIRTTGSSGGIDAGAKLTPWIRYAGQGAFTQGVASITVQSDGTFTWTREIKRSKGLTAYVSWVDTESNRVFWAKVR